MWIAWGAVGLLLCGQGVITHRSRLDAFRVEQRSQAQAVTEELGVLLRGVEELPSLAVRQATELSRNGRLSAQRWRDLQAEVQPLCRLYRLGGQGPAPPGWLAQLAQQRLAEAGLNFAILRPLPPGFEVGRVSAASLKRDPSTPEEYLAVAARGANSELFLAEVDLHYLSTAWLKKRLEKSPLGEVLTGGFAASGHGQAPLEQQQGDLWSWTVPSFFVHEPASFQPFVLHLDLLPGLERLHRQAWTAAIVAALLMSLWAAAIAAIARAVRRELEYAEARTRFTAMVSHELRTPLSAIAMVSEILREGLITDPGRLASYHAMLGEQTDRLQRMIERVLTFAQLEQGRLSTTRLETSCAKLLQQAAQNALERGEDVSCEADPGLVVVTDPDVVVTILENLTENALKHSQGSRVELSACCQGEEIVLRVLDRGPGVPQDLQPTLFTPYVRGSQNKGAGLGLGLAIAKALAESVNGSLQYRPREGGGSEFSLRLPGKPVTRHA
jgi:signal transduction histidine kinase